MILTFAVIVMCYKVRQHATPPIPITKAKKRKCIPSPTWQGRMEGYVFKTSEGITGYYVDE